MNAAYSRASPAGEVEVMVQSMTTARHHMAVLSALSAQLPKLPKGIGDYDDRGMPIKGNGVTVVAASLNDEIRLLAERYAATKERLLPYMSHLNRDGSKQLEQFLSGEAPDLYNIMTAEEAASLNHRCAALSLKPPAQPEATTYNRGEAEAFTRDAVDYVLNRQSPLDPRLQVDPHHLKGGLEHSLVACNQRMMSEAALFFMLSERMSFLGGNEFVSEKTIGSWAGYFRGLAEDRAANYDGNMLSRYDGKQRDALGRHAQFSEGQLYSCLSDGDVAKVAQVFGFELDASECGESIYERERAAAFTKDALKHGRVKTSVYLGHPELSELWYVTEPFTALTEARMRATAATTQTRADIIDGGRNVPSANASGQEAVTGEAGQAV